VHFNLALLLVILTAVSGLVWLVDWLFFAKARRRRVEALGDLGALPAEERRLREEAALREPTLVEYARSFFPVLLLILVVRSFIAEPFKIPSGSMMPTLLVGDFILVNKFSYGVRLPVLNTKVLDTGAPQRGDVAVFRFPRDPRQDYIKRVIGVPGDQVTYRNRTLYVNGQQVPDTYVGPYVGPSEPGGPNLAGAQVKDENLLGVEHRVLIRPNQPPGPEGTWTVQEGQYFVMGDSRDNSADSRFWGFVPEENLVGKAFLIWMNCSGSFCTGGFDLSRIGTVIR